MPDDKECSTWKLPGYHKYYIHECKGFEPVSKDLIYISMNVKALASPSIDWNEAGNKNRNKHTRESVLFRLVNA